MTRQCPDCGSYVENPSACNICSKTRTTKRVGASDKRPRHGVVARMSGVARLDRGLGKLREAAQLKMDRGETQFALLLKVHEFGGPGTRLNQGLLGLLAEALQTDPGLITDGYEGIDEYSGWLKVHVVADRLPPAAEDSAPLPSAPGVNGIDAQLAQLERVAALLSSGSITDGEAQTLRRKILDP